MQRFWILLVLVGTVFSQNTERLQDGFDQLNTGDLQKAESTFRSIVDVDKKNAPAWCGLGRTLDALDPGSAEAERAFNRAIRYNRRYGEAYYYSAVMWTHRPNRHKEAIEQLKLAVHFSPELTDAWELLGYLHEQNANEKPAVLTFSEALLKNPQHDSIYQSFLRTAFDYQFENIAVKTLTKLLPETDNPGRVKVELADAYRRLGETQEAITVMEDIESSGMAVSPCHANQVKARLLFDMEQDEKGCEAYWAAVDAVRDSTDRTSLYNDICFILQDSEYNTYSEIPNDRLPTFLKRLWRSRDPNLATELNERIPEHYRRLSTAEKNWRRSPIGYAHSIAIHKRTTEGGSALMALKTEDEGRGHGLAAFREYNLVGDEFIDAAFFPKALPRDRTLDDLAVVYIRHGEPTREITPNFSGAGNNITWIYEQIESQPRKIFHFQRIGEHTGWVLEAIPSNTENLETIHGRYLDLQDMETDELRLSPAARGFAQEVVRENLVSLEQAMLTETTNYTTPETRIALPYQYLIFKGEDKSEVDLFYLIHGGAVTLDSLTRSTDIDEFIIIHNDKWDEVARHTRKIDQTMDVSLEQWAGSGFTMQEAFSLPPGDYFSEFQAVDNIGFRRAIHKDTLVVPDYQFDQFMLSDVIIAGEIDESIPAPFERNGIPLTAHMFYAFNPNDFVGVYFEIYNLQLDDAGKSRYEVSFTLQASDLNTQNETFSVLGFVKNLFMDKRQVSSRFENEGRTRDDYIYMNLQFPDRKSGRYDLIFRVRDVQSGQVTSTQTQITLL